MSIIPLEAPDAAEGTPDQVDIAYEAMVLDRLFPGWWEKIDTAKLNLVSWDDCIVGQATGNWLQSWETVIIPDGVAMGQTAAHVRNVRGDAYSHNEFIPDWVREIELRRERS